MLERERRHRTPELWHRFGLRIAPVVYAMRPEEAEEMTRRHNLVAAFLARNKAAQAQWDAREMTYSRALEMAESEAIRDEQQRTREQYERDIQAGERERRRLAARPGGGPRPEPGDEGEDDDGDVANAGEREDDEDPDAGPEELPEPREPVRPNPRLTAKAGKRHSDGRRRPWQQ